MGQLGDLSPQGSVAVGIVVGLLSTSIQSLGLTLQRKSHLLEDGKDVLETRRPPYKRRRWQAGMCMFVLSNLVGSTIQITTLPLPVLSTLQASGLVFNTAFATLLLKEPFTRFSLIGTILTCGGAALIAIFGAIGEPAHSLSQLLDLLGRRQFIIWMVGTLLVAIATIIFAHVLKLYSSHKHFEQHLPKNEHLRRTSISNQTPASIKRSFTANLPQPLQLRMSRLRLFRGLAYALISGILSAHSLLVAKSAVELLVRTIVDHNNQFNRFQSWLILLALLVFALSQLYYLHLGLRLCSTSVLYPFVFCIYNIIAILDGLIYFRQASRLTALHAGLIAIGTVVLLSGVLCLSWRLDDSTPTDPAAPTAVPPPTPLAPGMGLVRASEDSEHSPLLPTMRPRSSASASRESVNEQTPLLYHRPYRIPTLPINPSAPAEDAKDIWAELDDAENDTDYLASLPRNPSPFFMQQRVRTRRRSRGDSVSSLRSISGGSRNARGSSGSEDSIPYKRPQRSQTLQTRGKGEYRRSSAPGASRTGLGGKSPLRKSSQPLPQQNHGSEKQKANGNAVEEGAEEARARTRSHSAVVKFAEQPSRSRWDAAGGKGKADSSESEAEDPGG